MRSRHKSLGSLEVRCISHRLFRFGNMFVFACCSKTYAFTRRGCVHVHLYNSILVLLLRTYLSAHKLNLSITVSERISLLCESTAKTVIFYRSKDFSAPS